jgi:hypothetical protein
MSQNRRRFLAALAGAGLTTVPGFRAHAMDVVLRADGIAGDLPPDVVAVDEL